MLASLQIFPRFSITLTITPCIKLELDSTRGTPLELLKSYLRHRQHDVKIGQTTRLLQNITAGGPRGSTLGPLLINDLGLTDSKPTLVIYADNASLFITRSSTQSLVPLNVFVKVRLGSETNSLLTNTNYLKRQMLSVTLINRRACCQKHVL